MFDVRVCYDGENTDGTPKAKLHHPNNLMKTKGQIFGDLETTCKDIAVWVQRVEFRTPTPPPPVLLCGESCLLSMPQASASACPPHQECDSSLLTSFAAQAWGDVSPAKTSNSSRKNDVVILRVKSHEDEDWQREDGTGLMKDLITYLNHTVDEVRRLPPSLCACTMTNDRR